MSYRNDWFTKRNKTELRRSEVLELVSRHQIIRDKVGKDWAMKTYNSQLITVT